MIRTRTLVLVACAGAFAFVVAPFWVAIVLALWLAGFLVPLHRPLARRTRSDRAAAAMLTLGLVLAVVVPLALAFVPLTSDALALVRRMIEAGDARKMLETVVDDGAHGAPHGERLFEPSLDAMTRAWPVVRGVAGATTHAVAAFFVFIVVAYGRLLHGAELYSWLRRHAPIDGAVLDRLAATFDETGRGLFVGIGGAALAQALVATTAYVILGVPHALVLGALTFIAGTIPGLGTSLAWAPVAGGLALTGRPVAALIIVAVGILLVGTIDNVVKPVLTRYGRLQLPSSVVFVAMLGGLVLLGPKGILIAPLVVRWAKELLLIAREAAPP